MAQHCLQAIVLAAGRSSRFNCSKTKLSFSICGQEMILYPIKLLAEELKIPTTVVLGYQKEAILEILNKHNLNVEHVEQKEQIGTANAVSASKIKWHKDDILIINGDMPLITADVINSLIELHLKSDATISFVTAHKNSKDNDYGRVILKDNHMEIVEAREFDGNTNIYTMINAGIYLIRRDFLEQELLNLQSSKNNSEYYITDLIKLAMNKKKFVQFVEAPFDKIRGVNTHLDLCNAEEIKRKQIISFWMEKGVRFISPDTVRIDINTKLSPDAVIGTGVELRGNTIIGNNCLIDSFSIIDDSNIKNGTIVYPYSYIKNSTINESAQIGPYAHIKNESIIDYKAVIGNFVEVTKSFVGSGSKVKHLSYIGNTQIGSKVNIGAGTITCNYNGFSKENTVVHDKAFIGSNCSLIAPITIGQQAIIGAGSVITKDVPSDALSLSRSVQLNKENYVPKLREKLENQERAKCTAKCKLKQEEVLINENESF